MAKKTVLRFSLDLCQCPAHGSKNNKDMNQPEVIVGSSQIPFALFEFLDDTHKRRKHLPEKLKTDLTKVC